MIIEIFTWLTKAIEGNPFIAIGASFIWGILSIILSPCHLASIPLIVGYVDEQGQISIKRAFWISVLFALGILVTIGLVGLITAFAGRMLGDIGAVGNYIVAVIFFVIGLHLLDVIPLPWLGPGGTQVKRKGLIGAFIIGSIFGLALGPCTFAYMAPMLGVIFKVATARIYYAIWLLLAFGIGHCLLIVLVGTLTETVARYLHWTEKSKTAAIVKKICGVLVILGGIYLITTS
ncbi:MAG TPA: cytochrome C biogenesis protein [candidate division WOR-3 bacterium]|uniref:Cytochrome C biogenesis protein n=1 Tax=candidate division WOR-3 bacterium TaxID=2052148 RepID=A0A9C9K0B7_UNCW3|nr:cytochrome C biogenesis protein [candidate division WOR-3 bacterium]